MSIPVDQELYQKVRDEVWAMYDRPSAYRSGQLVKRYKEAFKRIYGDREPYTRGGDRELGRWFKEKWEDVNPFKMPGSYPVYRPTVRVSKETPLTISEVDPSDLVMKSIMKQRIRGTSNLPRFLSR